MIGEVIRLLVVALLQFGTSGPTLEQIRDDATANPGEYGIVVGGGAVTVDDATANDVTVVQSFLHTTSGLPMAGIGAGILLRAEGSAGAQDAARIAGMLTNVGAGAEASALDFSTRTGGGALGVRWRIDAAGDLAAQGAARSVNVNGGDVLSVDELELADSFLDPSANGRLRRNGVFLRYYINGAPRELYREDGTNVAVADGGTGADDAAGAAENLGLGITDSPQFAALSIGGTSGAANMLYSDSGAGQNRWRMDADAGQARILSWSSGDSARWAVRVDGAEGGADAGADIALRRYSDAGAYLADAWAARRSDGRLTIPNVNITGGSIAGITDLAVADGGTGASNASGARTNLGLVIGTNVQAWDQTLDGFAAVTTDATKRLVYATGVVNQFAGAVVSDFVLALFDDANAAEVQGNLSLVPGTDVQVQDSSLQSIADASVPGTNDTSWTCNADASAASEQDPSLVLIGGDGSPAPNDDLVKATLVVDTDGETVALTVERNRNAGGYGAIAPAFHVGTPGGTADLDPAVVLNGGTGAAAATGTITVDGGTTTMTVRKDGSGTLALVGADNLTADATAGTLALKTQGANRLAFENGGDALFSATGGGTADPDIEIDGYLRVDGSTELAAVRSSGLHVQTGGGAPAPCSACLVDLVSTTQGLRLPVMTTAQREAIADPTDGLIVYDATIDKLYAVQNSAWAAVGGGGGPAIVDWRGGAAKSMGAISSGGASATANFTGWMNAGHLMYLKVTGANGSTNSTIGIYSSDSFAGGALIEEYVGVDLSGGAALIDRVGFFYDDADSTDELHVKITNNGSVAETYTLHFYGQGD